MKVAIVHDWFTVDGGAEKVCRELVNLYPDADIFSLIDYLSDADRKKILNGKRSHTTFIQKFPMAKRKYRYYLPWFPLAIEQLNLEKYDLVISSSYAVAKGVLVNANQLHICYCHSPMRYLWDLYFSYISPIRWYNFPYTMAMRYFISKLRLWDIMSSNRVDTFVANSENIRQRIAKVYRRDSIVIYPPVDTACFQISNSREESQEYYITASRLVPYKKVDLILKAFQHFGDRKLKIVGDGPEMKKLMRLASGHDNIEILGFLPQAEYAKLLANAKAFINASHEDFGIAPLEAQTSGTPVIGFAKGGLLETTRKNKTAIYFYDQSINAIQTAVEDFEEKASQFNPEEIRNFAKTFNRERFQNEFTSLVEECLQEK